MPTSCWGRYAKLAVIKQEIGSRPPSIIADTARGKVVRVRDRLFDGKSDACARARAERELTEWIILARAKSLGVPDHCLGLAS